MKVIQASIFDHPTMAPLAADRDPLTSHIAADEAEHFRAKHCRLIVEALRKYGEGTKDEIAEWTGLDHVAVARRMGAGDAVAAQAREILRTVRTQLQIFTQSGKSVTSELIDFAKPE